MAKKGRTFNCTSCPEAVQKLRRCREDRWDFTAKDSNVFPVRIQEGGGLYGFCPAKATWDHEAINLFELMTLAVEHKAMLVSGGLADQPGWFISLLAWFGPAYDLQKFVSRAKMVLGDGEKTQAVGSGTTKPTRRK